MSRRLVSEEKLERIYEAAVHVLGEMGMKVENRECLEAMERFGATIDYPQERALMSREVIDRMLEIVQSECAGWEESRPRINRDYTIGGGGTCPFIFDDTTGERRRADETDCIQMLKVLETSPAAACEVPVSNKDAAPKFEAIRINQLGIETLKETRLGGTDLFYPEQVPFAVELGRLYRDDPAWFLPAGNCPNSPLEVSKTIADLAVAKAPYDVPYAVPTMPVSGANAPMTPAGTAVVGVAEILGGYVLAKSLNPKTRVCATALCAAMDMKSGNMVYVAPEVFAADTAIMETFQGFLGLPCRVHGLYVEATAPGLEAMRQKITRCLGLGLFGNLTGLHGTLDQGKLFSPTQMMLDYDMHRFLAAYTDEPVVDEDALGVDTILDIGWDSTGYMMHDHTLTHMREYWTSSVLPQGPFDEAQLLDTAREQWQENLKRYEPPNHSDDFLRELRAVCDRAKQELA